MPTEKPFQKSYWIAKMRSYILLILDLERLNYDYSQELFENHYMGFGVFDHLQERAVTTSDKEQWNHINSIVKTWIYGTSFSISASNEPIKVCYNLTSWLTLEKLFRDNKEAKLFNWMMTAKY
ncbi:hypothetical protein LXL04_006730 [Taraxacum kok-saghyz]